MNTSTRVPSHGRRIRRRFLTRTALAGAILLVLNAGMAAGLTIKLASQVGADNPLDDVLQHVAAEWARVSNGAVELKIFPGGIAGDGEDVIRKMRIGQLDAAAMEITAFDRIYPGMLALVQPMLIRTDDEMIAILDATMPFFAQELEQRGFVAVMWAPIGWVNFFSREPVRSNADLRRQKLWIGNASPAMVRAWRQAGFDVVTLPETEVATALQSGMIDAYVAPPVHAAYAQWFGVTPHMNDLRLAPLVGALVVSKRTWERIPADVRPRLLEVARAAARDLRTEMQALNQQAVEIMTVFGLKVHQATGAFERDWQRIIDRHWSDVRDELIDPRAYALVQEKVSSYRAR